jgi:outer membrane protein
MNKKIYSVLFFFTMSGIVFPQSDTLTVDKCIDIALNNNPQIKLAESNLDISSSSLKINRSSLYPQVSEQSNWTNNGGTFFVGPTSREANYQNFSSGFNVQQLLYDFGKTYSKISAYSDLENASEKDLISAKQDLILNTYIAYFSYLQAERTVKVSQEELKQSEGHLKEAQEYYNVGKSPQFDVLKAQTDVNNAQVNLLDSENGLRISKLQLENELNKKLPENFILKDNLEVVRDTIDQESALNIAMDNRPELISSKYQVQANKSFVTSAWASNLPALNAVGNYLWKSYAIDQKFLSSWNVGVNLSIPIFQGFQVAAQVQQAEANLSNSEAENELTLQAVKLDVQQQYANLQLASSKIAATKSLVDQSRETLKLAEGRYAQQVGSALEVTDARVSLYDAQLQYIQALYDYQVAYVKLRRAMGILK